MPIFYNMQNLFIVKKAEKGFFIATNIAILVFFLGRAHVTSRLFSGWDKV